MSYVVSYRTRAKNITIYRYNVVIMPVVSFLAPSRITKIGSGTDGTRTFRSSLNCSIRGYIFAYEIIFLPTDLIQGYTGFLFSQKQNEKDLWERAYPTYVNPAYLPAYSRTYSLTEITPIKNTRAARNLVMWLDIWWECLPVHYFSQEVWFRAPR